MSVEVEKARLDELIADISKRVGKKREQLLREFEAILEGVKKRFPNANEKQQIAKARQELKSLYRRERRTAAVSFEGIIIGATEPIDLVARMRDEALKVWQQDKLKAMREGYCDARGTPLDRRQELAPGVQNPDFGKPLPQCMWRRMVFGIAKAVDDKEPKLFALRLRDDKATQPVPLYQPVKFRANIARNQNVDGILMLNQSVVTEFTPTDLGVSVDDVLASKVLSPIRTDLKNLLETAKKTYRNIALVQATAVAVDERPRETGSRLLILEDDSLDLDMDSVACFVPESIPLDFGPGSVVTVFGRVNERTFREQTVPVIVAFGVYAHPALKVKKEETPSDILKAERVE